MAVHCWNKNIVLVVAARDTGAMRPAAEKLVDLIVRAIGRQVLEQAEVAKKKSALKNRLRLVKVPTMAYLDPEQAVALRELSAKSGKPMQSYLREGVDLVLAKHGKARK